MRSPALPLCLLALLFTASSVARGATAPESRALETVKVRAITLLSGGDSSGPRRMAASEPINSWTKQYLAEDYEPIHRDPGDPHATTGAAADRASELRRLAEAYTDRNGDYYRNKSVLKRITASVDDLLSMYDTPAAVEGNWHSWLITIPNNLGVMSLLLEEELPPDMLQRIIDRLAARLEKMVLTGANAAWEARNHVYLALLTKDIDRLSKAAERVFADVRFGIGICEDYSYLFHGAIPYAGGYGAGFAKTVAHFAHLFAGTPWALEPERAAILENLLLEHSRWFLTGPHQDMLIDGRSYAGSGSSSSIVEAMLFLAETGLGRAAELRQGAKALLKNGARVSTDAAALADELMESTVEGKLPMGFRYWPVAEMGIFRAKDFNISFRQYSERVQDYEYLTQKGGEGWNLAMGFTNITRNDESGSWYDGGRLAKDIDMEFVTGATSREGANPSNTAIGEFYTSGYSLNYGSARLAGGAGWGMGGVAGFILDPPFGGFRAKKSLHFFDRGYWALGSAISIYEETREGDGPVRTNVVQWRTEQVDPKIEFSGGKSLALNREQESLTQVEWVWFDRVGIVFDEPTDINVDLNGQVVTVWIDHGHEPMAQGYAYAVLPIATIEETKAFAESPPLAPVRNDLVAHVVAGQENGRISAVFFKPGESMGLSVDHPAIVYQHTQPEGGAIVFQNPLHTTETIRLSTNAVGPVTFAGEEVQSEGAGSKLLLDFNTQLGRIYNVGLGDLGKGVTAVPRADLSDPLRFKVAASSTAKETLIRIEMPRAWQSEDYSIGIQGFKGHHLVELGPDDIVKVLEDDVVIFRWDRALTESDLDDGHGNSVLLQRSGDFRITYDTERVQATDYFTVPVFDGEGNRVENADFIRDLNNPYRPRKQYETPLPPSFR